MRNALLLGALAIVSIGLSGCAAADPPAGSAPFAVPLFDGLERGIDYDRQARPDAVPVPSADALVSAVVACYPARSLFRAEVGIEAGARQYVGNAGSSVDLTTGAVSSGDNAYIGIVARIPLWSDAELDRQREQESRRRQEVAQVVGALWAALAERSSVARMLSLSLPLERRAQERVKLGVANTSEQVGALETVAKLTGDLGRVDAKLVQARLALLALCEVGRVGAVDAMVSAALPAALLARHSPEHPMTGRLDSR